MTALRRPVIMTLRTTPGGAYDFQKSACIETLYTELPFLERFHAAKADGFDFVEFWSWTDKDLAAVKAAADAAGVGISGFNGDAELSLIDPAQKTAYKAFLRRLYCRP